MPSWMKSRASKMLPTLLVAISLSACGTTAGLIPPDDLYPISLTRCSDEPRLTARADPTMPRTEREKASYIKELRGALFDCHDKVDGWADRRERYVKQYESKTYGYIARVWRSVSNKAQ